MPNGKPPLPPGGRVFDPAQELLDKPGFQALPARRQFVVLREHLRRTRPDFPRLSGEEQTTMVETILGEAARAAGRPFAERALRFAEREAAPTGAAIGGTAGFALGGAAGGIGAAPGAVVGATTGAAAMQSLVEIARPFVEANPETANAIQRSLMAGIRAGAYEMALPIAGRAIAQPIARAGRAVGRAARGGLRRVLLPKDLEPEIQAARKVLQRYQDSFGRPLEPSLAQMTGKRAKITDFLENVAENSFLGKERFAQFRADTERALADYAGEIVRTIGDDVGNQALGVKLVEWLHGERAAFDAAKRVLYRHVDELAKGASVDTSQIVEFLRRNAEKPNVKQLLTALDSRLGKDPMVMLNPTAADREILGAAEQTFATFTDTQEIRSVLRALGRLPETAENIPLKNTATFLAARVNDAMHTSARGLSAEARSALDVADDFFRAGRERLNNKLIRQTLQRLGDQPGKLSQYLLQRGNVDILRRVKSAVGIENYQKLQRRFASEIVLKGIKEPDALPAAGQLIQGQLDGSKILTAMSALGDDTLREALAPAQIQLLRRLANSLQVAAREPQGPGRVLVQLMQGGAAIEMTTGVVGGVVEAATGIEAGRPIRAGAAIIVFGPSALSRVMSNPDRIRRLADAVDAPRRLGLAEGTRVLTRIIGQFAVAARENVEPLEEPKGFAGKGRVAQ